MPDRHRITILLTALTAAFTGIAATAHASGYLHRDKCKAALLGANGDNDARRYAPHYFYVYFDRYFVAKPAADRVVVALYFSYDQDRFPHRHERRAVGYCIGTDRHIVDKVGRGFMDRPAGWGRYPVYNGEVP